MKTSLDYLPTHKQIEIATITKLITETIAPDMIILFGSYARNGWVEEKYEGTDHYRYQSDFDVLVIVETKSQFAQSKFECEIEDRIAKHADIKTPVSIIVHDIDFVNRRLSRAQYFFTDIKKEGVLLYDSGKSELREPRELSSLERKKLAEEDFQYWFTNAKEFWIGFQYDFQRGSYKKAAFELHQVAERLLSGILLVLTYYKPNTHDLYILRKLVNSVDSRLGRIFPLETPEDKRLFKLLKKAYVDARYKPSYVVTHEELIQLSSRVEALKDLGEMICQEKIASFID